MVDARQWVAIRLSALGDVLLTTGVLRYWHEKYGFRFRFVTRDLWTPLLSGHPGVSECIGLQKEDLTGMAWPRTASRLAATHVRTGLIDLHGVPRTRLLRLLWQGEVRSYRKYSLQRRLFGNYGIRQVARPLLTYSVPQRYSLALESSAPPPESLRPVLYLDAQERAQGRALLGEDAGRAVLLHPFATHPNKRWPRTHWRLLMERLDEAAIPWRLFGRKSSDADDWTDAFPAEKNFINRTDLRRSAACIADAACLVTGDSGPMHMGTAVGTPVVALFGPTHRAWGFYPSGERDQVLEVPLGCRPCSLHGGSRCDHGHACMQGITVDMVFEAIARNLRTACPPASRQ